MYGFEGKRIGKGSRRRSAGFTLMEVMVAMGVIAIGTLTVSLALIQSIRSNRAANSYSKMVALVTDWTERLQGIPRVDAQTVFPAWPGCTGANEYIDIISGTDTSAPGTGTGHETLVSDFGGGGTLTGSGVIISYNLQAFCPPARQNVQASPNVSNSYRLVGRAFLVEEVAPPSGNYTIISSHEVSLIFSDRPTPGL